MEMTEGLVCLQWNVARDKARELSKHQILGFSFNAMTKNLNIIQKAIGS